MSGEQYINKSLVYNQTFLMPKLLQNKTTLLGRNYLALFIVLASLAETITF